MGGILVFLVWKHRGVASSATKDEKTRAALGIFAHYDKLLLYHSNTKYTHPITAFISKNNTRWATKYIPVTTGTRETLAVQRPSWL